MKKLVVLTGAGMSAESGIATFRGSDGLWENHRIEDVASPEGWRKDKRLVLTFYNQRRKKIMEAAPNAGHLLLAAWERHFKVCIITQNIDDLHERAGSTDVLHLHGEIMKARSTADERLIYTMDHWELKEEDVCEKGAPLRPHIVWFGEEVPMMSVAAELCSEADLFLVVGTSLQVYPAASLVHYVRPDIPQYIIDPSAQELPVSGRFQKIAKGGSEGLKELEEKLLLFR